MKKVLVFSILVFSAVFYAYFQIYLKKQEKKPEKPLFIEKQKLVEFYLTTAFSEIKIKLKDNLWFLVQPHPYPADQNFVEQNFEIMTRTPVFSTFPLKEDRFGFKPAKAFMEFVYNDGLRKRLIIGKTAGPRGSLYVLDRDSHQVFVVHSVFGQFLYHSLSMFFHKSLPIPGKTIRSLKRIGSQGLLWEIRETDGDHATVFFGNQSKKIPKKNLSLFFKNSRRLNSKGHQFKKPESFKKLSSLLVETEKKTIQFDFDDKKGVFYSETQNVLARFNPSSLRELGDELKKVMENEK